ncbi:hypothetical protein [Enhygromyxa salina]|uniref:Uncharacterized protein n=1 Tax=Enhygromyxa salina TaxID=215803 RepID=A0A2S9YC66_9BACT|nr:hypothetical protein [Enhygromyxa salina]PRQ02616.1 hypothetical protein ENSA7_54450 [Enhygromyxa salina]
MVEQALSVPGSASLAGLCIGIAVVAAAGVPAARWYAGVRGDEPSPTRRAATLRTGVAVAVWLSLTGALAGSGALANFESFPPPVMPVVLASFVLTFVLAFSRFGERLARDLPLSLLVGYQGFRVVVEIMLHRASEEGVIGQHMTWSGLNFDVVTGLTGLGLGLWLWRREQGQPQPRALLWVWNLLGLGLLATIVGISILSMPGPLRQFGGPPNVWIADFPFVWLPTIMVTAALFGHLLVFRRLLGPMKKAS